MRQDVLDKARHDPRGPAARLLDAAEEVFAECGFAAASTREVARRARVPFGALHYYWGSKKELREAVYKRLTDGMRETLLRQLPADSPEPLADRLTDAFLALLAGSRNATRLLYRAVLEPRDERTEQMFLDLASFGIGVMRNVGLDASGDPAVTIFVMAGAFLTAVADEPGQRAVLGGSIFTSRPARRRLRAELRRLTRAALGLGPS